MGRAVAMAARSQALAVDTPLELVALRGMVLLAAAVATARFRMLALGRESTSRKPTTSMLVSEVISTS